VNDFAGHVATISPAALAQTHLATENGAEPDLETIALHEPWAKGLIYCDMQGFAIDEDDTLILLVDKI